MNIILASTSDLTYLFFAPVAARCWRQLGHAPYAFLTREAYSLAGQVALGELEKAAEIFWLDVPPGCRPSTVAQVARLLGSTLPVGEAELLMTSDVDMVPLNSDFFAQSGPGLTLFHANAYAHESFPHYPMCYVSAPKSLWAELFGRGSAVQLLPPLLPGPEVKDPWFHDELLLSQRLCAHPSFAAAKLVTCPHDPHGMVARRVDRAREVNPDPADADDMHCWRPGYSPENWARILSVIAVKFSQLVPWCQHYRDRFVAALDAAQATVKQFF
jgi:hypothetical protein